MKKMDGAALLITVWLIALATVLALNYARTTRSDTKITAAQLAQAEARAAAEAGIWRAVYEIDTPHPTDPWPTNGDTTQFDFNGTLVEIVTQDVTGLVDLNSAPEKALTTVFTHAIGDEIRAKEIVNAILDWRDRDDKVRDLGAEDQDYIAAGAKHEAKDGAFNTREELQLVLGVSLEDYAAVAPYLTVFAQRKSVNVAVAPQRILAATEADRSDRGQASEPRRARRTNRQQGQPGTALQPTASTRGRGTTFEIFAKANIKGAVSQLATTVQISRGRRRGPKVAILSWHETWPVDISVEIFDEYPPAG